MFGNKKVEHPVNPYDEQMRKLKDELAEIGWNMDKKIRDAYIKAQAVAVYYEGSPDWKQAIADRNAAQERLHCSIGAYDSKRAEILRLVKEHGADFDESWSDTIPSHTWIEWEINNEFLKKF